MFKSMVLSKRCLITLLSLILLSCTFQTNLATDCDSGSAMMIEKSGPSGTTVPFLMWGDSRTRGAGSSTGSNGWAQRLAATLPPYYAVNIHGVDGDNLTAHSSSPALVASFTAAIAALVGSAPRSTLILQYDINDFDLVLPNKSAAQYGAMLDAQLTSFQSIAGLKVIVFASLDSLDYLTPNSQGSTLATYLAMQTSVVASHSNAKLVQGRPMLTWDATASPTSISGFNDAKHPNDIGYTIIRNLIAPQVQNEIN